MKAPRKKKTKPYGEQFCKGCGRCDDCGKPKTEHLKCPVEAAPYYPYDPIWITPSIWPNTLPYNPWGTYVGDPLPGQGSITWCGNNMSAGSSYNLN
jgi:hypothetical protein